MWWQDGTAQGSSALMPWDELHMTLLSSFVPELSPASAGFFLWGPARPCRRQAVCPGSRGNGVCSLLSSVMVAVSGLLSSPRGPRRARAMSSSVSRPSSRA